MAQLLMMAIERTFGWAYEDEDKEMDEEGKKTLHQRNIQMMMFLIEKNDKCNVVLGISSKSSEILQNSDLCSLVVTIAAWMKIIGYETAISDICPWQQQTK